jgi:enolase-phosphatase E1
MRYILTDVEGTTTSIRFVHDELFPYSLEKLEAFLRDRRSDPAVGELIAAALKTARAEGAADLELSGCVEVLKTWIRTDRKHPALKSLQGLIWKSGYESGEITGHVYDDVPAAFRRWKKHGLEIGIYSSGSVLAQRLLFGHTRFGDLNPFVAHNFDTGVGPKREPSSYREIARRLELEPAAILFLSDTPEELGAARTAGFAVLQLVREGVSPSPDFEAAADFEAIDR